MSSYSQAGGKQRKSTPLPPLIMSQYQQQQGGFVSGHAVGDAMVATVQTHPKLAALTSMPASAPVVDPRNATFIGQQQQGGTEQTAEGKLTPRGRNRYTPSGKLSCTPIVAWIALFLSFFACIMVAIIYFNWAGGPLTQMRSDMELLKTRMNDMQPIHSFNTGRTLAPSPGIDASPGNSVVRMSHFTLTGQKGQFVRWPDTGGIAGMDFNRLVNTRICCHVNEQYFVCDSGQGATDNVGLECIVQRGGGSGDTKDSLSGTHLLVYVQSEHMNGAKCTFMWQMKGAELPALLTSPNKDGL